MANEIEIALLIPGMLLKRDARGQLPLLAAAASIQPSGDGIDEEYSLVANAK